MRDFKAALSGCEAEDELRRVMTEGVGWHERPSAAARTESYPGEPPRSCAGWSRPAITSSMSFPLLFFKRLSDVWDEE